jgi:hypothetical protein
VTHPFPFRALAAAVIAAASSFAAAEDPTVMCHPGPYSIPPYKCLPLTSYIVDFPWTPFGSIPHGGECPRVSSSPGLWSPDESSSPPTSVCVPQSMAPPFPTLSCGVALVPGIPTRRVVSCAAYPTSPRLQYSWITSGAVVQTTPNDPLSSTRDFNCSGSGGGTVQVTITSPFGRQSSQTASVSCANPAPRQ